MLKKIASITLCTLVVAAQIYAWENQEAAFENALQAKSKTKPSGPPGPPGPQGPPGNLVSNYAAAYGETQHVFAINNYSPIDLGHEQTSPTGVIHPVNGNLARFQVANSGIFHIGWSFSATNIIDDTVSISLFNVSTSSFLEPAPLGVATVQANTTQILSGQMIVALAAGTIFEFQVCSQQGNALITPKATIIRIAQ